TSPYLEQVEISDLRLWRYDPNSDRWIRQSQETVRNILLRPAPISGLSTNVDELLWPVEIGLYWVSFTENGASRSSFVFKGPVACNDVCLGEPPKGKVPACVPFKDSAEARFVPDPKIHCR